MLIITLLCRFEDEEEYDDEGDDDDDDEEDDAEGGEVDEGDEGDEDAEVADDATKPGKILVPHPCILLLLQKADYYLYSSRSSQEEAKG